MKHLRLLVVGLVGLVLVCGPVSAAERKATQKAWGGITTSSRTISATAAVITGVSVMSTSSVSVVGIYDSTSTGAASNALCVWEGGAAANASTYVAFDPPIRTTQGVTVVGSNIAGVVVYVEQATP
jgi:hypothetical protein